MMTSECMVPLRPVERWLGFYGCLMLYVGCCYGLVVIIRKKVKLLVDGDSVVKRLLNVSVKQKVRESCRENKGGKLLEKVSMRRL